MSKTILIAIAFTVGLTAGVFLSQRLKTRDSGAALDLRIRSGDTARVRSVVDGDTIVLENGLHLRYSGINAPESGRFVKDPAPLSAEATARNRELVEGKDVRIELGREPLDMYGRALGRVYIMPVNGGTEVDAGEQLVREGLAKAMNLGLEPAAWERLRSAQDAAKQSGAGIWNPAAQKKPEFPAGITAKGNFISATGSGVYHVFHCAMAQRIKLENRRYFTTALEAGAQGLRPCETCLKANEDIQWHE